MALGEVFKQVNKYIVGLASGATFTPVEHEIVQFAVTIDSEHLVTDVVVIDLKEFGASSALAAYGAELDDLRAIMSHQIELSKILDEEEWAPPPGSMEFLEKRSAEMYRLAERAAELAEEL